MPAETAIEAHNRAVGAATGSELAAAVFEFVRDHFVRQHRQRVSAIDPRRPGGGITGLQWVVDGYTSMFAALLLSAGSLHDRVEVEGALRADC